MKPFIILHGNAYYPDGWGDYIGEADSLAEAKATADAADVAEGDRGQEDTWWQIIDLRTKECVLTRCGNREPYDPRSS